MQVEVKKAYVAPKLAELGTISTITLGPTKGGSVPCIFTPVQTL
jgi:hypothetical protein